MEYCKRCNVIRELERFNEKIEQMLEEARESHNDIESGLDKLINSMEYSTKDLDELKTKRDRLMGGW